MRESEKAVREFLQSVEADARAKIDGGYLRELRLQPCVFCSSNTGNQSHHYPHKRMGGGGDWSDYLTVPACRDCHAWWHEIATREEREGWANEMFEWMLKNLRRYWCAGVTQEPHLDVF